VDEAGETDTGDMARGAEDTFEVPDSFRATDVSVYMLHARREYTHGSG
jgi:hypothetical protein